MTKQQIKGYALGAIGAALYGTNPFFALKLYEDGMNTGSVLFFRYLIAIPLVLIMMGAQHQRFEFQSRKQLIPLLVMGLMMATSSISLFLSYTYMPGGIASTILFIYPLLVAIIMAVLFKEKMKLATVVCIVTALLGIMLLYDHGDGTTLDPIGTVLVVVSAVTYAIYIVGINRTTLNTMHPLQTTFFLVTVCVVVYLVYLRGGMDITLPTRWYLWLYIIALAVLPTVLSFTFTTYSIQTIGSTSTAILGALEPATAVIIGLLVFGEQMTARIAIGLILIIMSVTFVVAAGKSASHLKSGLYVLRKRIKERRRISLAKKETGEDPSQK